MAWIQATQVLTICPDFGDPLRLWVCAYDYQLLSYYLFREISATNESEIVNGIPVIGPEGQELRDIERLFSQFRELCKKGSRGSVSRSSYLRKIEILYNRVAGRMRDQYKIIDMPLGRRASLYIAAHSSENLTSEKVAKALGASEPAMNHALLVVTGMNFNQ